MVMNWSNLENASRILGVHKEEVKAFIFHLNGIFTDPIFRVNDDYTITETKEGSFLIVVRFDPEWQADDEEVAKIRAYNPSKIKKVRLMPREERDGCYFHITWLKSVTVETSENKKRKYRENE